MSKLSALDLSSIVALFSIAKQFKLELIHTEPFTKDHASLSFDFITAKYFQVQFFVIFGQPLYVPPHLRCTGKQHLGMVLNFERMASLFPISFST